MILHDNEWGWWQTCRVQDVDSGDMGSAWVCHMYTTINWMGGTYTTINRWAYTTSTMGSD